MCCCLSLLEDSWCYFNYRSYFHQVLYMMVGVHHLPEILHREHIIVKGQMIGGQLFYAMGLLEQVINPIFSIQQNLYIGLQTGNDIFSQGPAMGRSISTGINLFYALYRIDKLPYIGTTVSIQGWPGGIYIPTK